MAEAKVHLFNVEMTCEGCSNAVNKVLGKHKDQGINDFQIDLSKKTVSVTSSLEPSQILAIIQKTGKNTSYVSEI